MGNKGPITTHVLDTSLGKPSVGIAVLLELKNRDRWIALGRGTTDADGRVLGLLPPDHGLTIGTYRLTFDLSSREGFYPEVAVSFTVADPDQHYHVPVLLSPFGYSTYRGS